MAILRIIFIFSLIFSLKLSQEINSTLRWTFGLINHGARSPHKNLDENFKDFSGHSWIGLNELTGVGLRQSFLVGYRDRLRYIEEKRLISEEYDPREILVYASENNRTLMSANALLHGLYPPGTGPTIDPSLVDRAVPPVNSSYYEVEKDRLDQCDYTALPDKMNLIPVHINFAHEYFTQYESSKKCPRLKKKEEDNQKREEVNSLLKNAESKYKNLEKIFNTQKDLKDYEFAYTFFDTLYCLYHEAEEEFDAIIEKLDMTGKKNEVIKDCQNFLEFNTVGNNTHDKDNDIDFIDYLVSPLFHKILHFMELVIEKDKNGEIDYKGYDLPRYYLISAVANTCGSFMAFMNKNFKTKINFIDFATNIHLELYLEDKENGTISESDYRVEYYFNDEFLLSIPFVDFKKAIGELKYNQTEVKNFCNEEMEDMDMVQNWYIIWAFVGLGIILILLVAIIIVIRKRKLSDKEGEIDGENQPLVRDTQISS